MIVRIAVVALAQLALVGVGVAPQLSARLTGEEIQLRVRPVDPMDPFRGAYVDLGYPDLQPPGSRGGLEDGASGDVYVTLAERDGVWVGTDWTRERPAGGTYLACTDRSWRVRCGIESWFLPQDEAAAMQAEVGGGTVATVTVDSRGNAALVGVGAR